MTTAPAPLEGVIRFEVHHEDSALPPHLEPLLCRLTAWRDVLAHLGLIGQAADRYDGAGFGNVSARVGAPARPRGERGFVITGTQTGGNAALAPDDYAEVQSYAIRRNAVTSRGRIRPSSESMTHGALYDVGSHIRFVFHGHAPVVWGAARELGLPVTDPRIEYGTPQMADEVQALARKVPDGAGVIAMGGHEDGVIGFGRSAEEAGMALVRAVAAAWERSCLIAPSDIARRKPR